MRLDRQHSFSEGSQDSGRWKKDIKQSAAELVVNLVILCRKKSKRSPCCYENWQHASGPA